MMNFKNLSTSDIIYLIISAVLICMVLFGIFLLSRVKKARLGNGLSAIALLAGIILVLIHSGVFDFNRDSNSLILGIVIILLALALGSVIGIVLSKKVKMIEMPQLVALLNGLGGAASAIVGITTLALAGKSPMFSSGAFALTTAALAISVGMITLSGSLIAAGKLHRILPQKQIVLKGHQVITISLFILTIVLVALSGILVPTGLMSIKYLWILLLLNVVVSTLFGLVFSIRVGGADMPITISLLNSFSGVAGAIAGLALYDILLVAIGGIVGASGLILTQIMCKAINRSLIDILLGKAKKTQDAAPALEAETKDEQTSEDQTSEAQTSNEVQTSEEVSSNEVPNQEVESQEEKDEFAALRNAKDVIIVPGYGMAIAQAQHLVKELANYLVSNGAKVRYAIHPVAGRMPGHMNVLLCEADVDYEDLFEMSDIDADFKTCDAVIVVGANDVLNPAANTAVGTPIYGMPVLSVNDAKEIYIFNYDTKPGYAGVDNPIYERKNGVHIFLGNASDTLQQALDELKK